MGRSGTDPSANTSPARWSARPWTARAIRAIAFAGPLLVSVVVAWIVSSVAPRPESFVVAIVRLLPGTGRFARLSTAVAACTVGAVVSFNAIDPEGLIVRHNLAAQANGHVDLLYIAALSDDADRALFARLDQLSAEERVQAVRRLCAEPREPRVFWAWNRSAAHVRDLRRNLC